LPIEKWFGDKNGEDHKETHSPPKHIFENVPNFSWVGFGVSGPQWAENDPPPLIWLIALTTV